MKKAIVVLIMIIGIFSSCSEEISFNCDCVEVEERMHTKTVNNEYVYLWVATGVEVDIEGCYTEEEAEQMINEVSYNTRWSTTCVKTKKH